MDVGVLLRGAARQCASLPRLWRPRVGDLIWRFYVCGELKGYVLENVGKDGEDLDEFWLDDEFIVSVAGIHGD